MEAKRKFSRLAGLVRPEGWRGIRGPDVQGHGLRGPGGAPYSREAPHPVVQPSIDAIVNLPLYIAEKNRRRFFQQVGKAADKFNMKLARPHADNLVAPFLVKERKSRPRLRPAHGGLRSRQEAPADAGSDPSGLAATDEGQAAPGIWLQTPSREDEPSESSALVGKAKDRALMLKKLGETEVRSLRRPPRHRPAHYGKAIGKCARCHQGAGGARPAGRAQVALVPPGEHPSRGPRRCHREGGSHAAKAQEEFGVKLRTKSREHPESGRGASERSREGRGLHRAPCCREAPPEGGARREELRGTFPSASSPAGSARPSARRDEHILVLGPEGCRAAWIEREFGVRFVRPSGNMPLVLEGDVEAVTGAEGPPRATGRRPALCQRPSLLISAHGGTTRDGDGRTKRPAFLTFRLSDSAETGNIL
ncbi:hypothetical protein C7M84_022646 [Penaeus vannamei]|uniref:Uncharacterized protein n=1 Tax=Penaeus vannamei TaxID=6689 RepID=A0A423U616_PENVA|nr:hypothetical protein C7M84_022646 [Penaeus vannamei]